MKFNEWYSEFMVGKTEVLAQPPSTDQAIHSPKRFICRSTETVWEIGKTYTDRLVVRSGSLEKDGISIRWEPWKTLHDVELS